VQPAQHGHHQQITGAEPAIKPIGIAEAAGKVAQPLADAVLEETQALLVPRLVAFENLDHVAIKDRRLNRIKGCKHPSDRARPAIRIARQQTRMALRDMEYDRPRLEQREIAFFISRNLPERVKRKMRGLLHCFE
jgi:hypothetical protein